MPKNKEGKTEMFYLLCFFFKRTFFITKVIIFCEEIYGKISMQHMKGMIHKMEKEFESTRNALVVNLVADMEKTLSQIFALE